MGNKGQHNSEVKQGKKRLRKRYFLLLLAFVLLIVFLSNPNIMDEFEAYTSASKIKEKNGIENGIHVQTGFVDGEGLATVIANCTGCHSAQLVIQNRMNKERWDATIRWMQETQNLWDLGENQEVIVNYLVSNYPLLKKGRRENLMDVEWYVLEE